MRLTSFVVCKSWASNPLRTALSVLGVALGVAIVTAIHVVDHNTIESQLLLKRPDFGRVDLELVAHDPEAAPAAVRAALAERPEIAAVGVLQQGWADVAVSGETFGTVAVYGLGPLPGDAFTHYLVDEGRDLSDLDGDTGVLVGRPLARLLNVAPGAELVLSRPRVAPRQLCKEGVRIVVADDGGLEPAPRTVTVRGILAERRLGKRDLGMMMVTSFALARGLAPKQRPIYQINRHRGVDIEQLREQLSSEFEVLDQRSALLGEAADERAFRNGVKVLGCLALVLGMFVIFQTLSQSLVERLRQIGLLRCLGTARRAVAAVFLIDASATAVAGAVLGLLGGVVLSWLLMQMGISTLGRGKSIVTFELPLGPMLWTAFLGVLFTLLGAAFPLIKARNVSPMQVLATRGMHAGRDGGDVDILRGVNLFLFVALVLVLPGAYLAMTPLLSEESGETMVVLLQLGGMLLVFGGILLVAPQLVQRLGALMLWPLRQKARLPAFLVAKSLQQSPGRFAASVCGLAVVLMALIASKSLTTALRAEAVAFGDVAMHQHLFLKTPPMTVEEVAQLAEIPGVAVVDGFRGEVAQRYPVRGLAAAALARDGGLFASSPHLVANYSERRSVVISRRFALLRHLSAGDRLPLLTDSGPVDYDVLGVSDAAGFFPGERAWAVTDPRWMHQDFCVGDTIEHISVTIDPGAGPHQAAAEIRGRLRAPWIKFGDDITDYSLRDIDGDFVLFDVLLGLVLVLAGIGLVNTMTIAALGHARETGVLRALGVARRQLRTTFVIEGAVIAVIASLLALVAAVPLGWIVVSGLNSVAGLEAPFVVPWRHIALVPVLALLTGGLAAILPGMRALGVPPADAVRYE